MIAVIMDMLARPGDRRPVIPHNFFALWRLCAVGVRNISTKTPRTHYSCLTDKAGPGGGEKQWPPAHA